MIFMLDSCLVKVFFYSLREIMFSAFSYAFQIGADIIKNYLVANVWVDKFW